ncbi:putative cytosolic iron-sulfur protein assembly protein CIAO1 like protein [Tritrichomonas foetus]|uniref:Cytosolic iron-sulfur protein assembly protein CIAO1 like protein n=1 Tax=Tritrichomonas foetus TaxID=1144522 RepID=A0A1J4KIH2_9EUKA|nr:putative cytosolic iron-sulfur protein assembly protein CIAO1 like protein [Tritrichomonas foetus]|eukprot:OHT10858.1 putative cytosolic iron-sulfur protein assembly protein CIAO1 like protein [Tritrichomonas foetus]
MQVIEERDAIILDLNWHPNGKYLAVVGSDGFLRIFEGTKKIFETQRKRSVRRVEWSPDGNSLVTAGFDANGIIYHFDPAAQPVCKIHERLEGQDNELKTARWSHDGKSIVTCSRDKSVWVWNSDDGDCIAVHRGHTADIKDAMFAPDDQLMASVSFDGTMKLWDPLDEAGEIQSFEDHEGTIWGLAFNPNNSDIVSIGEDGKAILYRKEGEVYKFVTLLELQKALQPLYSVTFCDNEWIITGSERIIYFIDENFEKINRTVETQHIGDINCCRPCPTQHNLLATGSDDGTVVLINV